MSDRRAHELLLKETLDRPVLLSVIAGYGVATYLSVALILSVVGNTLVLCYTRQHKISRIGRTVRRFLLYLAINDLLINPVVTLPMLITTITRRWVLGELLCISTALMQAWIMLMEIWIVTFITIQKFYNIIFPLRFLISVRGTTYVTTILAMWCLIPLLMVLGGFSHVSFYPESLTCCIEYAPAAKGRAHGMLAVGVASVYTLFPLSVVTCLYVVILREAKEYSKRRGEDTPFWRAPLTVSLVVGLFMVSVGPGVVTSIYGNLVGGGHLIHPTVWTVQCTTSLLNTLCNPIVYIVTNSHFKEYCQNKTRSFSLKTSPLIQPSSPEVTHKRSLSTREMSPNNHHRGMSPTNHHLGVSPSNYHHRVPPSTKKYHQSQENGYHCEDLEIKIPITNNQRSPRKHQMNVSDNQQPSRKVQDTFFTDALSMGSSINLIGSQINDILSSKVGSPSCCSSDPHLPQNEHATDSDLEILHESSRASPCDEDESLGNHGNHGNHQVPRARIKMPFVNQQEFKFRGTRSFHDNSPQQKHRGRSLLRNHILSAVDKNEQPAIFDLNSV